MAKVRPSHAANNGKIFRWASPPPTGNPGDAINCRCMAEPYVSPFLTNDPTINDPPLEDVYPELLLIPLLRVLRLIAAWRAWALAQRASREWRMGDYKSSKRWAKQLEDGGWTPQKITTFIKRGKRYPAINKTRNNSAATRYQIGDDFVVVDNSSKEVIQVSRPKLGGFKPNNL